VEERHLNRLTQEELALEEGSLTIPTDFQVDISKAVAALQAAGSTGIYLFGSLTSGTAGPDSDIDLAVSGLPACPHRLTPPVRLPRIGTNGCSRSQWSNKSSRRNCSFDHKAWSWPDRRPSGRQDRHFPNYGWPTGQHSGSQPTQSCSGSVGRETAGPACHARKSWTLQCPLQREDRRIRHSMGKPREKKRLQSCLLSSDIENW